MMTRTVPAVLALTCLLSFSSAYAASPYPFWALNAGGDSLDRITDLAVDPWGNIVVVGDFSSSITLGGVTYSGGPAEYFVAKFAPDGHVLWVRTVVDPDLHTPTALAIDPDGYIVVVGYFYGTVNFGGWNLTSYGDSDVFVSRYTPGGGMDWSKHLGGTLGDFANDVVCGASGIVITGYFSGSADFGTGTLVSAGVGDVFLTKLNTSGVGTWSKRFGSTDSDIGTGVALGASETIYLTGQFSLTVSFGVGNVTSAGGYDVFLARYLSDGTYNWARRYGGVAHDYVDGIDVDAADRVVLSGRASSPLDFGHGTLTPDGGDMFVTQVANNGANQWAFLAGGSGQNTGFCVHTDPNNNVYVAGNFLGAVNFGGGTRNSTAGFYDGVLAVYGPGGNYLWDYVFGRGGADNARAVYALGADDIVLGGWFNEYVDFGSGLLFSNGESDAFVVHFGDGTPAPAITSVNDIGNDQGGKVRVSFDASLLDDARAGDPILNYEIYRRNDPPPAAPPADATARELLATGWTLAATQPAHTDASYSNDVPTVGDSTIANGPYYSVFYVRAATATPSRFYQSAADSGYSIDNLAPGVPSNLVLAAGKLFWSEAPVADFDYFAVYGSNSANFGAATLINYTVPAMLDVASTPYSFYFVTATDFSGNESAPAMLGQAAAVGDTPRSYVLSLSNYPNPFNPRTSVNYTVPARGNVTVAIYDARGARVAVLVDDEPRDAGAYRVDWAGRDDRGLAVPSGVYFARVEQGGAARTRKMVLLK